VRLARRCASNKSRHILRALDWRSHRRVAGMDCSHWGTFPLSRRPQGFLMDSGKRCRNATGLPGRTRGLRRVPRAHGIPPRTASFLCCEIARGEHHLISSLRKNAPKRAPMPGPDDADHSSSIVRCVAQAYCDRPGRRANATTVALRISLQTKRRGEVQL